MLLLIKSGQSNTQAASTLLKIEVAFTERKVINTGIA
jgi:hypothetical protein